MKKHSIISILFLGAILAQKLPYGKPNYFQIGHNKKDVKQITLKIPFDFTSLIDLFNNISFKGSPSSTIKEFLITFSSLM